jgi:hypothetical protein
MGDLQSQWTGLVRSMFNIANLSNLGFSIGNVGCTVGLTFQRKLILYCMSPFIISLVPMLIYVVESLVCFRKLYVDTKRRLRLAKSHQDHAALLNIDKGFDLDYIQSSYALEETELLHLSPECHLACNPTLSQFIDDERFSKAVQAPEGFRIVDLDPRYVELRISLVSQGYRRLWEIRKERSRFPTIQAYPLDQHGDEKLGQ